MGQFDRTIKHLLSSPSALRGLLKTLLNMTYVSTEQLDPTLTIPNLRQVDLLVKGIDRENRQAIVQIEFQTKNEKNMAERMEGYGGGLKSRHPECVIYQIVIYIGYEPLTMVDFCEEGFYTYRYYLQDIRQLPVALFLSAESPELAVMGVLSKPSEHHTAETFIQDIIKTVEKYEPHEKTKKIILGLLSNLVKLRNLTATFIKIMKKLELEFDESVYLYDDYFRQIIEAREAESKAEGIAEGKAEGIAEGKAEGKAEGIEQAKVELIRELYQKENWSIQKLAAFFKKTENQIHAILSGHELNA